MKVIEVLEEGRLTSKGLRKAKHAAKASGRRRKSSLRRNSLGENAQANAILSKADTLLQGTGFARQGFAIVKAPQQGGVRGSITDEALTMVKNMLAKAQAMGATDAPDPAPMQQPSQISNKEFGEAHGNSKVYDKCWDGYRKVPGKKRGEKGSCVKEDATAGGTSAGAIATVSNPSVTRNAKKPKKSKGVAPNALDSNAGLMSGTLVKR